MVQIKLVDQINKTFEIKSLYLFCLLGTFFLKSRNDRTRDGQIKQYG